MPRKPESEELQKKRLAKLRFAWGIASRNARLSFIDEDLMPWLGMMVLRGEYTEAEALGIVPAFHRRVDALTPDRRAALAAVER